MDIIAESDTYAPILSNDGKYIDCVPVYSTTCAGYYCPCGARKDKVYSSQSMMSTHMKTKAHQKWLEILNLNRSNHFIENIKLHETVSSQRLIIAKLEREVASKDGTIAYLTQKLTAPNHVFVTDLLD